MGIARKTIGRIPGARSIRRVVAHAFASSDGRDLLNAYQVGMTQKRQEIESLARLVRELRPARVLEIGTSSGGTFYLWTRLAADDATLISVDLPPSWALDDPREEKRLHRFRRFKRGTQVLHFLRRDSHRVETVEEVQALLSGHPVDFLFIDGDHSYEGVRKDFIDYGQFVRPGGVIAFHDIVSHSLGWSGEVDRLWAEIRHEYGGVEFVQEPDQDGFGIGVIRTPMSPQPK